MAGGKGSKREQGMEGRRAVVVMSYMRQFTKKKKPFTESVIWGAFHPPRAMKSVLIPSNEELKLSAMFIVYEVPDRPGINIREKQLVVSAQIPINPRPYLHSSEGLRNHFSPRY